MKLTTKKIIYTPVDDSHLPKQYRMQEDISSDELEVSSENGIVETVTKSKRKRKKRKKRKRKRSEELDENIAKLVKENNINSKDQTDQNESDYSFSEIQSNGTNLEQKYKEGSSNFRNVVENLKNSLENISSSTEVESGEITS